MTGIAWNEALTGPVESIEQLFEDPKLKGKVSMLMELADSVGLRDACERRRPRWVTDDSFNAAIERVQGAVDSGQVIRFTGNDFAQPLTNGTSRRPWRGQATSSSFSRTTRSSSGRSRRTAA